jgi:hypothetical protein
MCSGSCILLALQGNGFANECAREWLLNILVFLAGVDDFCTSPHTAYYITK